MSFFPATRWIVFRRLQCRRPRLTPWREYSTTCRLSNSLWTCRRKTEWLDGELISQEELFLDARRFWDGVHIERRIPHLEALLVSSDGASQIAGMAVPGVMSQALSFKTTRGAYLKRRLLRMLREWARADRAMPDDLGMACLLREDDDGKRESL